MFWEKFLNLCNEKELSPTAVCLKLGLSNAIATKWANGSLPRNATMIKIADFFGISVDYLKNDNIPIQKNNAPKTMERTVFAMEGDETETASVRDDNYEELSDLILLLRDMPPEKLKKIAEFVEMMK